VWSLEALPVCEPQEWRLMRAFPRAPFASLPAASNDIDRQGETLYTGAGASANGVDEGRPQAPLRGRTSVVPASGLEGHQSVTSGRAKAHALLHQDTNTSGDGFTVGEAAEGASTLVLMLERA
jgi:hypothetical protein